MTETGDSAAYADQSNYCWADWQRQPSAGGPCVGGTTGVIDVSDGVYSEVFRVTDADCISAIDGSLPSVLGTYVIVKWMEIASAKNVLSQLDEGHITVGRTISIMHDQMVRNGEDVEVISTIEARDGRRVTFAIEARSGGKVVATASHERVIIPAKLLSRVMGQ